MFMIGHLSFNCKRSYVCYNILIRLVYIYISLYMYLVVRYIRKQLSIGCEGDVLTYNDF